MSLFKCSDGLCMKTKTKEDLICIQIFAIIYEVVLYICNRPVRMFIKSEFSSSVPRRDGDAVRFFDDMDVSDRHLHTLHQSIRDLNSGQQRLRQELEEERLRRTRYFLAIILFSSENNFCWNLYTNYINLHAEWVWLGIIIIIRQLIRRRNMSIKSLQGRRTAYASRN